MSRRPVLDIQIEDRRWQRIPRLRAHLEKAAQVTLAHLPKHLRIPASATVLLTGDAKIRRLNHDFRGIDKATNVLSFPQFRPRELPKTVRSGTLPQLGDIAIAYQYVVAEAKRDHKILINHVRHLLIHGLLHLFGYDHLSDKEAAPMERLEKRVMAALDLPDPYLETQKTRPKRTKTGGTKRRAAVRSKR